MYTHSLKEEKMCSPKLITQKAADALNGPFVCELTMPLASLFIFILCVWNPRAACTFSVVSERTPSIHVHLP